ncbi:MAG TPA: pyridoxamine 5'-phosphate oxidase family protein [Candidatus Limnocylindria bacterium]|jgi:uncharacterized protein YhbP (UPF0306 family)
MSVVLGRHNGPVPIERSGKHPASTRLAATARRLLDESTLCAIATAGLGARAHINTAYFAWDRDFGIVWLSSPDARHSRNLRQNRSAAIAVYRSTQRWGENDRGIQLFGTARELRGRGAAEAERVYARRFKAYEGGLKGMAVYRLRATRMKLFDERVLGGGTFVTVSVRARGSVRWVSTESFA